MSGTATVAFRGLDGLRIVADAEGPDAGTPVLLLHGGGQNRGSWRDARGRLAASGFRAFSIDTRGHGDSDRAADCDYRIDAFAADIRALAAELARPVFLVGASLGGVAAAIAVAEAPGVDALGLVLVDVAHQSAPGGAQRILGFMTERPDGFANLDEAADAIAAYLPHRPRPGTAGVARSLRQGIDRRWRWHWDPAFARFDRPNALTLDPVRISTALRAIRCPTMLVRGGSSEIVSPEIAEEFRALMPGARYVDIPGATHMVAGDDNDAFAAAVIAFLNEVAAHG